MSEPNIPSGSPRDRISRSISREDLAKLPIRRYEGEVRLVTTPEDLARAREDILRERVVGFDTETRPAFRVGESYAPCLFQAATARAVYLFRFERLEAFPLLAELLAEPRVVKAGVSTADDLRALKLVFSFEERNVIDLGIVARRCGFAQTGLRNLAAIFFGYRIPKGTKTSNWAAARLTAAQIAYAAMDAWACRELFMCFEQRGLLQSPQPRDRET
jgi:ribonuclease D